MGEATRAYWKLVEIADKVNLLREIDRLKEELRLVKAENAEVLGRGGNFGVLVRDCYSSNTFRGRQQYCYEHLKRDGLDLLGKEPENG